MSLSSELSRARALRTYQERLREQAREEFPFEPMGPDEYRAIINLLGLTQQRAGLWLGLSPRQSQRYLSGDAGIPPPVAKLLRYAVRNGIEPKDI